MPCTHEMVSDKVYSGERNLTAIPQWAWICSNCGVRGIDSSETPPKPIDIWLYIRTHEKFVPEHAARWNGDGLRPMLSALQQARCLPGGAVPTKASDIPDVTVLMFLDQHQGRWSTHGRGDSMPTVQDAMPPRTPDKLQLAKMRQLHKRGFVGGCTCGCRGDWEITDAGLAFIGRERTQPYNGY